MDLYTHVHRGKWFSFYDYYHGPIYLTKHISQVGTSAVPGMIESIKKHLPYWYGQVHRRSGHQSAWFFEPDSRWAPKAPMKQAWQLCRCTQRKRMIWPSWGQGLTWTYALYMSIIMRKETLQDKDQINSSTLQLHLVLEDIFFCHYTELLEMYEEWDILSGWHWVNGFCEHVCAGTVIVAKAWCSSRGPALGIVTCLMSIVRCRATWDVYFLAPVEFPSLKLHWV